jgi:hypothetical protein
MKKFIGFLLVLALLFCLYTWLVLTWSYSAGERAGYVQKFSKKGWVCKTWEGELAMINMPGTLSEKFNFTVHDEAVVKKSMKAWASVFHWFMKSTWVFQHPALVTQAILSKTY